VDNGTADSLRSRKRILRIGRSADGHPATGATAHSGQTAQSGLTGGRQVHKQLASGGAGSGSHPGRSSTAQQGSAAARQLQRRSSRKGSRTSAANHVDGRVHRIRLAAARRSGGAGMVIARSASTGHPVGKSAGHQPRRVRGRSAVRTRQPAASARQGRRRQQPGLQSAALGNRDAAAQHASQSDEMHTAAAEAGGLGAADGLPKRRPVKTRGGTGLRQTSAAKLQPGRRRTIHRNAAAAEQQAMLTAQLNAAPAVAAAQPPHRRMPPAAKPALGVSAADINAALPAGASQVPAVRQAITAHGKNFQFR
jgi:hypothetical protein